MQTLVILLAILAVTCNGITRIIAQPSSDHASSVVHTTAVRDTAHPSRSLRVDRPERGTDRDSMILEHAIRERASRSRASDDYHHSRAAYKKEAQAARDRYYEEYFDRLRDYAVTLQRQRYIAMLEKQAKERAKLDEELKSWQDGSVDPNDTPSETTTAPPNPFEHTAETERSRAGHGARGPQRGPERSRAPQRHVDPLPQPPSTVQAQPGKEQSHRQAVALQALCQRFLPTVRKHCYGKKIEEAYEKKCKGYFQDCQQYVTEGDPLYAIAHSFNSNVGLNLGTWAVNGIPYYPINEEGGIGAGRLMNVPFGSWGGGYSDHIGVRDYWSQYQEAGANWYEGKYGYKSGWSVPLVQSLGVEGDTHATVSVPIKKGELGKPIGVDVGGGVGPYYQQNTHVGVDYMNGRVGSDFGVGVPMAGVGVGLGWGVKFPSVADVTG